MKKPKKTDRHILGLGWWWARSALSDCDEPVDLETIDAWRKGLLSAKRRRDVKRQLANDPRLMRQLEELIAADELVREFDTSSQAHGNKNNLFHSTRTSISEIIANLKSPVWVGGLATSAVAVLLLVVFLPISTSQNLDSQLDDVYANLVSPSESLQVPWTPKIVIRGGTTGPGTTADSRLNELLMLAFQAGMAEGMNRLETRFPHAILNPGGYVRSEDPLCHMDIGQCERQVKLAKVTGKWAVAVFLECQNLHVDEAVNTVALLSAIQKSWRGLSSENTLSKDTQGITLDGDPCQAVEKLLLDWGRPKLSTSATP